MSQEQRGTMSITCHKCNTDNPDSKKFCGDCGTSLTGIDGISISQTKTLQTPSESLTRGARFADRYEIIEKLGEGGMGKVYRVFDNKIDEEVALKLLKPEIASDEKNIKRFRNELKYARKITHKNVCRMYHLGEADGALFITMEYVQGEDLKTSIRRLDLLSTGKVVFIIKQICKGLAEAHKHGVIHRDLKPHNIMIDKNGNARIMDFGIVRSLKTAGITQTGLMVGTPTYMSPEQAEGIAATPLSDIYSLGVILFELVTGRVPFEGDTALTLAMKHKTAPVPDPREINAQIPEELSLVIFKCMEKDPAKRYQNAEELIADLNTIESSLPTTSKIILKEKTPTGVFKNRRKFFMKAGLLLAFAVVVAGGYFLLNRVIQPKREGVSLEEPVEVEQKIKKPETEIPKLGKIDINSVPSGADIYIENKLVGRTPLQLDIPPGVHTVTLKKGQDYQEVTNDIEVKENETFSGSYTLTQIPRKPESKAKVIKAPPVFTLEINTIPEGADVKIDDKFKGQTPFKIELNKNNCQLKIENGEEWSVIDEQLNLRQGLNSIHRDLIRLKYNFAVRTNPAEANVILGDELLGKTPLKKLVLRGIHNLTVEKDGFLTIEEPITVDSDLSKEYDLVKLQPGKIRIKVQPYATVFIDGELIGEVPPVKTQELTEGKHTIEFISTRMNKKYSVEVDIGSGESKEIRMNMETGENIVVIIDINQL